MRQLSRKISAIEKKLMDDSEFAEKPKFDHQYMQKAALRIALTQGHAPDGHEDLAHMPLQEAAQELEKRINSGELHLRNTPPAPHDLKVAMLKFAILHVPRLCPPGCEDLLSWPLEAALTEYRRRLEAELASAD